MMTEFSFIGTIQDCLNIYLLNDITSLFASQRCADQTSDMRDLGNLGLGEHTKTVYVRKKIFCTFWSHDDMFFPI